MKFSSKYLNIKDAESYRKWMIRSVVASMQSAGKAISLEKVKEVYDELKASQSGTTSASI